MKPQSPLFVSDADAERTATELAGPPVDSPAARAFGEKPKRARRPKAAANSAHQAVDPVAFFRSAIPAEQIAAAVARGDRAPTELAPAEPAPAAPAAAFPCMLPDRSWGASVEGDASIGTRIHVTTRAGKSWLATVTEVHFARAGRTIVTAAGDDPPEARSSTPRSGRRLRQQDRDLARGRRSNHASIGGRDYFVNSNGRCEDAPCCGCCT